MRVTVRPSCPASCDGLVVLPLLADAPVPLPALPRGLALPAAELAARADAAFPAGARFVFKAAAVDVGWQAVDRLAEGLARGLLALHERGRRRIAVFLPEHPSLAGPGHDRLLALPDFLRHDHRFLKTDPDRARPPQPEAVTFVAAGRHAVERLTRRLPVVRATAEAGCSPAAWSTPPPTSSPPRTCCAKRGPWATSACRSTACRPPPSPAWAACAPSAAAAATRRVSSSCRSTRAAAAGRRCWWARASPSTPAASASRPPRARSR